MSAKKIDNMGQLPAKARKCRGGRHHPWGNEAIRDLVRSENGNATNYIKFRRCVNGCGATYEIEFLVYFEGGQPVRERVSDPTIVYPDLYLWDTKNGGPPPTAAEWGAYCDIELYPELMPSTSKGKKR